MYITTILFERKTKNWFIVYEFKPNLNYISLSYV